MAARSNNNLSLIHRPIKLYPITNYDFGTKEALLEKDISVTANCERLRAEYEIIGMRRTVFAVILVYEHRVPHVLILKQGDILKLPGDELYPGEDEVLGLKRILNETFGRQGGIKQDWIVEDMIANWWRPNFGPQVYPYLIPGGSGPKERKSLYLVQLHQSGFFYVPSSYQLIAVPVCELYDRYNSQDYGPIISSLPQVLSRFDFNSA